MATQSEIREGITQKLIAALERGCLPWRRTWSVSPNSGPPTSFSSHFHYQGVNFLLLSLHQQEYKFTSKYYATFNVWRQAGGFIKKRPDNVPEGEWGQSIIYYNRIVDFHEDEFGNEIEESRTFLKQFAVFNLDQVFGASLDKFRAGKESVLQHDFENFEPVDRLVDVLGVKIIHGGDRAYYRLSTDEIHLPKPERFESRKEYYCTLLHELLHWTEPRLNIKENYSFGVVD